MICINVLCRLVSQGTAFVCVSDVTAMTNPRAVGHVGRKAGPWGSGRALGWGVLLGLSGCAESAEETRGHILTAPPSAWQSWGSIAQLFRQWSEGKSGLECCVSPPRTGSGPSRCFGISSQPVAASPQPVWLALTLHRLAY